jgi:hypothetical protein
MRGRVGYLLPSSPTLLVVTMLYYLYTSCADLLSFFFSLGIQTPFGSWQAQCWDPEFGSTRFFDFCDVLDEPLVGAPGSSGLEAWTQLPYGHPDRLVNVREYLGEEAAQEMARLDSGEVELMLDKALINYGRYIKEVGYFHYFKHLGKVGSPHVSYM